MNQSTLAALMTQICRGVYAYRQIFLSALLLLNLLSFSLYGFDKHRAKRGGRRIPERTLLLSAFFFGGIGAFAGMQLFRHKTKHLRFVILVPMFMILQLVLIGAAICFGAAA